MATKEHDVCRDRAQPGEPIFTLRAQDITADLVTRFWVSLQLWIADGLADGKTLTQIREEIIGEHRAIGVTLDGGLHPAVRIPAKLREAVECASAMKQWPNRKVAD